MATLTLDFLRNYRLGTYRESEPVAYQYDQGHVLNILVPGVVTSAEVQYWTRGMKEAAAYEVGSITQQSDGSYVIECSVPNEFFGTWGDLRVYLVVTDDSKYVVTYEGRIKVLQREKPEDYVDDDPDNEALRILIEAREAAQTATAAADRAEEVEESIPADYTELTDEVSELNERIGDVKSALNIMEYQNSASITNWLNGYIRPDGSQGTASNICFSNTWLEAPDTFEIVVTVAEGYKTKIYEYAQKSYSAFVKDVLQTYKSGTFSVLVNHSNVYKFTIMKNDESAFAPATLPDNPVSIVRHKLLSQTTLQGKIDDSINAFATSKYSTNRQLELANEGTATLLYGDYVKSIVPQKIISQSYIPFYKNDYIVFTAGSVVDMIDVDCYDSNYNFINTITQTGSGTITPFTGTSKGYIRIAVYNANSTPITNQNYDGSVVLFKANYNERNYKYKNVTIHTEKGKYDTTVDRYGGPVSNWPTGMINKYPIIVSGAKYVVFPQIQSTASKYTVYFRAQDGTLVSATMPTASISNNRVSIPASAYYMDVYIEYSGLYDFDVTIISETDDPYNLLGEKKRIYVNNNNGMVNYLQVDYEKGLYTALCIMLPPNYSYNGEKVPLVVWFDGNTNYPQMGSHFSTGKMPGLSYVRDEGFAVAQIFSWGSYMSGKYQYCGYDQPYPTPTCLKCILTGIDYICDRYNVDADNVHIMSKSMGGLISLYFVSRPIYAFKSIGMFSPILDMIGLRGRYPDARRAIFEDMGFSGDIEEFADIDFEGDTSTGVPNYYFSQRCCDNTWAQNMPQLAQLNSAWTNLVGDTLNNNFAKSISDSRAWYADIYATGIYNHPEYKKTAKIPVKIWGAVDDDNVQYQAMPEIIAQLQNSGVFAEMSTKQTGGHSAFDVSTQYAQDITTALGITHEDVPIGWIENVKWIRRNSIKYNFANNDE